jgi:bis(5'-adenosyl)-triphosphatase
MNQKNMLLQTFSWKFGKNDIPASQVFLFRKNVIGLVNLKPIISGHVLVCPRKCVTRLRDLNEIESCDLWLSVAEVQGVIEDIYKVTTVIVLNLSVLARLLFKMEQKRVYNPLFFSKLGQSVSHAHVHIIPKTKEEQKITASECIEIYLDDFFSERA